jgi:hypothetical protein
VYLLTDYHILAGLGLSLTIIFSCHFSQTSDLNLLPVRSLPLMQNLFSVLITNTANDTILAQFLAKALPDEYLLGITGKHLRFLFLFQALTGSGLCRRLEVSNLVDCLPSFLQNSNILTTVLKDLNSTSSGDEDEMKLLLWASSTYNAKQSLWTALGIASSVFLITSIIWMSSVAIYIWFLPQRFNLSMILILMNMVLALGAASIWTGMAVDQAFTFNSPPAPVQDLSYSTSMGPGFYLLWGYAACTLLVTPRVAILVSITFALIIEISVIFAFIFVYALLILFMATGGGSYVTAPFWTVTVDMALDALRTHTGTQTWH